MRIIRKLLLLISFVLATTTSRSKKFSYWERKMKSHWLMFIVAVFLSFGIGNATAENTSRDYANGVPYGAPSAATKLEFYFSIGCAHCLNFLDQNLAQLRMNADENKLLIVFVDIPGAVAPGPKAKLEASRQSAQASWILQCIAEQRSPEAYVDAIEVAIQSAKDNVIANGDWLNKGEVAWQNWVHAGAADLRTDKDVSASFVAVQMLQFFGVDIDDCPSDFNPIARARFEKHKGTGKQGVPLIVLNGEVFNLEDGVNELKKLSLIGTALTPAEEATLAITKAFDSIARFENKLLAKQQTQKQYRGKLRQLELVGQANLENIANSIEISEQGLLNVELGALLYEGSLFAEARVPFSLGCVGNLGVSCSLLGSVDNHFDAMRAATRFQLAT